MIRQRLTRQNKIRAALLLTAVMCFTAVPVTAEEDVTDAIVVLRLTGDSINPGTGEYLVRGMENAQANGAAAIILVVNTPGGMVSVTREIVSAQLSSEIPVLVWVGPSGAHAASAGTFVTLAGHVAAMAPGTNIGAAHPIFMGGDNGIIPFEEDEEGKDEDGDGKPDGEEKKDEPKTPESETIRELQRILGGKQGRSVEMEKALQDTLAWVESIAEERGRNVEWAKNSVQKAESITARKAAEINVVDFVAQDIDELLELSEGREVKLPSGMTVLSLKGKRLVEQEPNPRQRFLSFLGNPNLLFLFMILGLGGIYLEVQSPGLILPGVIGVLSLCLVLLSTPGVDYNIAGVILIILAFVLFIMEIYVPSAGLLTIGGLLFLIFGGFMLFDTPDASFGFSVDTAVVISVAVTMAGLAALVGYLVVKTFRNQVTTGEEGMVGEVGQVTRAIGADSPGQIFVHGEYWRAHSDVPVEKGEHVRVVQAKGLTLFVQPLGAASVPDLNPQPEE